MTTERRATWRIAGVPLAAGAAETGCQKQG
jgi:hypothetical protein